MSIKSVNVIRRPRRKSKLTQAKIKDHLERVVTSKPVRIQVVERYMIYDGNRNKNIEAVFVIYDTVVDLHALDSELTSYREIRYQIWEDGTPHGGGIFG